MRAVLSDSYIYINAMLCVSISLVQFRKENCCIRYMIGGISIEMSMIYSFRTIQNIISNVLINVNDKKKRREREREREKIKRQKRSHDDKNTCLLFRFFLLMVTMDPRGYTNRYVFRFESFRFALVKRKIKFD